MPSVSAAAVKILLSLAAESWPYISKFRENEKENLRLKAENRRLKEEADYLRKQRLFFLIIMVLLSLVFFTSFIIVLTGAKWVV